MMRYSDDFFCQRLSGAQLSLLVFLGMIHALDILVHYALTWSPIAIATYFFEPSLFHEPSWNFGFQRVCNISRLCLDCNHNHWSVFTGIAEYVSLGAGLKTSRGSFVAFALIAAILICGIYVLVRFMGTKLYFMLDFFSLSVCSVVTLLFIQAIGEVKMPESWVIVN